MEYNPLKYDETVGFSFADMYPALEYLRGDHPVLIRGYEDAFNRAREFRAKYVEPFALEIDRRMMREPTFQYQELLEKACEYKFFSMSIPRMFGGGGLPLGALVIALEEIGAGCMGFANIICVHFLGFSCVAASCETSLIDRVCRRMVEAEKRGRPYILSTAITEPGAGSDVEDEEHLKTAKLVSEAKRVSGGYLINGRKCFISMGSMADEHVCLMPIDKKQPVETFAGFMVRNGTPGFSIGKTELKMGQKACPAVELIFEDCFVPEEDVVATMDDFDKTLGLVLGATRGSVGCLGAAIARGAFERALSYCRAHKLHGKTMTEHQWVQFKLTDMFKNVMAARAVYVDAILNSEINGLTGILMNPRMRQMEWLVPKRVASSKFTSKLFCHPKTRDFFRSKAANIPKEVFYRSCAYGDAAKVVGTDIGMENCGMAIELMGMDGLRHDMGMEKLYRDAKLLQIYEGTNQLNRIDLYKRMIAPKTGQ